MIDTAIQRLEHLIAIIPVLLRTVNEEVLASKPSPLKWSQKEILGHLIDSATNNHQRFVRGQFEDKPVIFYDQNQWVAYNHYQETKTEQLIEFCSRSVLSPNRQHRTLTSHN